MLENRNPNTLLSNPKSFQPHEGEGDHCEEDGNHETQSTPNSQILKPTTPKLLQIHRKWSMWQAAYKFGDKSTT